MTEQELTPTTRELIEELVGKYPKKKLMLKEYFKLNSIETLDDMSEDLGLDILEQMDSVYYVKAVKRKRELEAQQYHQNLINAVEEYLAEHIEDYIILDRAEDAWLVSKKITITVRFQNTRNVFHEFEKHVESEYFIVLILKISDTFKPTEMMSKFMARGVRMVKLLDQNGIGRTMKEVT